MEYQSFNNIAEQIDCTFTDIEIALDEIERAQRKHPDKSQAIACSFPLLIRTGLITSNLLYRHHVRELIQRHSEGHDTRPATLAEVLGGSVEVIPYVKTGWEGALVFVALVDRLGVKDSGIDSIISEVRTTVGTGEFPDEVNRIILAAQQRFEVKERLIAN